MPSAPAEVWDPRLETQLSKFAASGIFTNKQISVLRGFLSKPVKAAVTDGKDKTAVLRVVYQTLDEHGIAEPCKAGERIAQRIRPKLETFYRTHSDDPGPALIAIPDSRGWFPEVTFGANAERVSHQMDARLEALRTGGPLHGYHVTVKDGRRFWMYLQFDFSSSPPGDVLRTKIQISFGKQPIPYDLRLSLMGEQLLLMHDAPKEDGISLIALFPFFRKTGYNDAAHSLAFHEDWHGQPRFTPMLIAKRPITGIVKTGRVPAAGAKRLEKLWTEKMRDTPINLSRTWKGR